MPIGEPFKSGLPSNADQIMERNRIRREALPVYPFEDDEDDDEDGEGDPLHRHYQELLNTNRIITIRDLIALAAARGRRRERRARDEEGEEDQEEEGRIDGRQHGPRPQVPAPRHE